MRRREDGKMGSWEGGMVRRWGIIEVGSRNAEIGKMAKDRVMRTGCIEHSAESLGHQWTEDGKVGKRFTS